MQCADGKVGFLAPSDGMHSFAIADAKWELLEAKQGEKKGTIYKTVNVRFEVVGDEEEGRSFLYRYFLENDMGRLDFAKLIYFAKISSTIEKKYQITDNLDADKWAAKYLNVAKPDCESLANGAANMLIGRTLDIKVSSKPSDRGVNYRLEYFFFGEGPKVKTSFSAMGSSGRARMAPADVPITTVEAPVLPGINDDNERPY